MVTVYLADLEDFPELNEIYAGRFSEPYPARAVIEVSALPKDAPAEYRGEHFLGTKVGRCRKRTGGASWERQPWLLSKGRRGPRTCRRSRTTPAGSGCPG